MRPSGVDIRINVTITGGESDEQWTMWIANNVLNARPAHAADVQLTVTGPKPAIVGPLTQPGKARDLVKSGALTSDGDTSVLDTLASVMEDFDPAFNLATP
jgi:alkyl sulfatase BDS1-like metallo-beta-lactamase superfamily hydrolase